MYHNFTYVFIVYQLVNDNLGIQTKILNNNPEQMLEKVVLLIHLSKITEFKKRV